MITYIGYTSVLKDGDEQIKEAAHDLIYDRRRLRMEYEGITYRLITQVCIGKCADDNPMYGVGAIWDTGSGMSCISERLARKMGLTSVGSGIGATALSQGDISFYEVDVQISDKIIIPRLRVAGFPREKHGADFLIGMDIIAKGNFSIKHEKGKMIFEFEMDEK